MPSRAAPLAQTLPRPHVRWSRRSRSRHRRARTAPPGSRSPSVRKQNPHKRPRTRRRHGKHRNGSKTQGDPTTTRHRHQRCRRVVGQVQPDRDRGCGVHPCAGTSNSVARKSQRRRHVAHLERGHREQRPRRPDRPAGPESGTAPLTAVGTGSSDRVDDRRRQQARNHRQADRHRTPTAATRPTPAAAEDRAQVVHHPFNPYALPYAEGGTTSARARCATAPKPPRRPGPARAARPAISMSPHLSPQLDRRRRISAHGPPRRGSSARPPRPTGPRPPARPRCLDQTQRRRRRTQGRCHRLGSSAVGLMTGVGEQVAVPIPAIPARTSPALIPPLGRLIDMIASIPSNRPDCEQRRRGQPDRRHPLTASAPFVSCRQDQPSSSRAGTHASTMR